MWFKKVDQQESELQSPILPSYELTIPTSLPLYLFLAYHGSEVAHCLVILVMGKGLLDCLISELF